MSDNFFVAHPEVTRYILEKEAERKQQEAIIIQCDYTVHTWLHPYCDDPACGCHVLIDNLETFQDYIEQPLNDGLLTTDEAHGIYWNTQI